MLRLIPRLDIKGPNLVKGVHMEGLRVLGDPRRFARAYFEDGADELIYVDTVASLYGRNQSLEMISSTSREIPIPITVSGGIRSLEDIREALASGADKVAINSAAVLDPSLLSRAAKRFGSSTVVLAIDAQVDAAGVHRVFIEGGRQPTSLQAIEWAIMGAELGAGEILIHSIDRDGTGLGYDTDLVVAISKAVAVPVIGSGGAGSAEDAVQLAKADDVHSVAFSSILHYGIAQLLAQEADVLSSEGNTSFLTTAQAPYLLETTTIGEIKQLLLSEGVLCRPTDVPIR